MAAPKDDLKWFGEGFDGFPKRLPEDCVEYLILLVDEKLTPKEILSRLEAVRKAASTLTNNLLKDYIWQRDAFELKLEVPKQDSLISLHGVTNYGDSVEDEWLIVYLLRELSRQFPDVWIRVFDTDGEFLLIEAANALPKWLNPEIADNRVWIHNNELRIIPLKSGTSPSSRSIMLEEARKAIATSPKDLVHSSLVQEEAFYRLRNYPAQISDSLHHALISIPRKLAYVLHSIPTSIAPAVEAFYLRDPIALKPLQSPETTLVFPPEDLVTVSVRFTKVLFAQVKSQQFQSPAAWRSISLNADSSTNDNEAARLDLGMKVTSGFEMLVTDPANRDKRSVREIQILLDDLSDGISLPTDAEIKFWDNNSRQDDEKWLDINFEEFEKELQGKRKQEGVSGEAKSFGPAPPSGFGDAKTQEDLKKIVERFESFLNDEDAGIEGAEMDEMDFDDDDDEDEEDDSEDEDKEVSFDEKEFARMMREMMGMPPEDEEGGDVSASKSVDRGTNRVEEVVTDEEEDEAEELRKVMQRMEEELNKAGALDLDPTPVKLAALKSGRSKGKQPEEEDVDDDSDEEVNIDFNLAKNLLESFKSQGGMAGPGGNIMGMMGMRMPLDEDESQPSKSTKCIY